MKKKLLANLSRILMRCFSQTDQHYKKTSFLKVKLSFLFSFVFFSLWAQPPHNFSANGTLVVPAGITTMDVQAWGAGGAGGGASGSGLVEGRSGGGGGGGAYAAKTINVVASNTLNIVVGAATTGTTGNGANGGNSTIVGYESIINAAGGAGGIANNAGGSVSGGSGGLVANSFGDTRNPGENGGGGGTVLAALFLSTGKGGNGASPGGGTGGPVFTSTALGTSGGSAGTAPGGGGSGAMCSALAGAQTAGGGARGQVIVTYTCPTYGITSVTAANACTTSGTSVVTLTSSAASLPTGTYTVTYNRSAPAATGRTITMIVTTAGTGSFTETGLTAAATNATITITNLTSGVCSSNISTGNIATFDISSPSVGGTVTGGTTICSGFTSALLTLGGHTGTIVKWQSSTNSFSTFTDITNPSTTYTSGPLTQTTQFRAVIQNGVCATANSVATEVVVNPLPTITLGTVAAVCTSASAQNTTLTYSATTNSPTTYSITWNASPTNSFAAVTNVALPASPISIAVPAGTAPGTYTGTITVRNANTCVSTATNFNVVVNPLPTITLGTVAAVCTSASAQNTTLTYSATTNSPTTYSITWNASPTNSFAAVTDAALPASPISIAVPAGTAVGTYTGTITVKNANTCVSTATNFNVVVNPLPTITLGTVAAVCTSASAQNTTLTYSATTNSPTTYSITWNASPTNSFAAVTNVALPASPISIAVPAGTAPGTYTGTITVRNANTCVSTATNFNVVVNPLPTITLGTVAPVCTSASAQNTSLTYSATTNSPTTYSITWNASPTNSFAAVTDAALPASPISIAVPAGTAAGTYTGTITVKNANTCVSTATNFNVVVNPLPTITLGTVAAVCTSASAQNTNLTYSATTNSPTTYSITWNGSPTNSFAVVTDAALPANPISIAIPAGTAAGTYTGTITVKNANTCVSTATNFNVVVNPLPTITLGTVAAVCTSASAQNTSLSYSATTNSPTTYSIIWNASPSNSFAAVTNAALPASPISIAVPAGTAAGTYTGTITVSNANTCVSTATNFNVVVNPLPTITLGTVAAVCTSASAQNTNLTYSATTNSPTTYSITWNASPTNSFAAVTDAALPASPISIAVPAGTAAGTYTGTITVKNANTCVSTATNFNVVVNPLPTITLGTVAAVCTSASAQNTTLTYSATTNSPTTYSITWNASPSNSFAAVTDAALPASPISIAVPAGTAAGTYTGTITVKNANTCVSTATNFNVVVNPLPTITLGTVAPVCTSASAQNTSLTYSATTNSPTTYSITWNASPTNSFAAVTDAALPASPISIAVPAGTAVGTYTGTITVKNANTCVSTATNFNVVVNPLPTITLGTVAAVCTSASAQNTTLTYSATTNSPTTYSITWNASPINSFVAVTDVALPASPISIAIPAGTAAGTYTGTITVKNANTCVSTATNFNVVVNPLPTITLGTVAAVCTNVNAQNTSLSYSATTNSPTTYSITWNASPSNSFAAVTNAALPASPISIAVPAGTAAGTYTGTITVSNANTCISTATNFNVVVNPLPTITLGTVAAVCASASAQNTTLTYSATTNSPTTYSITWNASPTNSFAAVTNAALPASPISIAVPAGTAPGTYTGTITVRNANTCVSTATNFNVVVNPIPTPTFTVQPAASVCVNSDVTYTTQAGQSNYIWNVPGTAGTDYNITSGSIANTSNTVTLQWVTTGSKTVTVNYTSIGCASVTPVSNTTNAIITVRGVVNGGTHICSGDASPLLTLHSYTGTIVRWEYAESIPYVWQTISHTSDTYQPGILTTSTSYRAVVKNGSCPEEASIETRIDVEPKPSTPIVGTITQPTCIIPTGSVTLSGLLATPNWTITQNGTPTYTATGTSYTITNLAPGDYVFAIYDISICQSVPTATVTINAPVTNIWNGTSWSKGSPPVSTDAIRFSGNYSTTGDLNGCSCTVDPGVNVTVNANNTLTITNPVTNNGGQLIFENNASLIQINDSPTINTGNITYKRTGKQLLFGDFTYWSSPVHPQALYDVSPLTLYDKYYSFNGTDWVIENPAAIMQTGKGYLIRSPQTFSWTVRADYTAPFIGIPNNGNLSGETMVGGNSYLIGNPYPSALSADLLLSANTFLEGTIFFWTHNTPVGTVGAYEYSSDDYASYNVSGGVGISAVSDPGHTDNPSTDAGVKPTGKIAAGQSFFATAVTSGTVTFNNSMRSGGTDNNQFFKMANPSKTTLEIERHRVWLNMTNTGGAFKQLLVGYIQGATNEHDNIFDGISLDANQFLDFYSINSGRKYVIQGRALPFTDTDTVPLGYRSAIISDFTISIDETDGNLLNQDIYIEDKKKGILHNLRTSGYTFSTTIGVFDDRFILRYKNNQALGVDDPEGPSNGVQISTHNKTINIDAFGKIMNEVTIYDMSGKAIYKKTNIGDSAYQIVNLKSQNQVLVVKVKLDDNTVTSHKIVF